MRSLKVLLIVVLLVFGIGVGSAAAAPVAATASLPYVWVRSAPSSSASVVYTVYPTSYATLQTTGNTQSDGYQTWAEVAVMNNPAIRGWVEQGSLVSAGQLVNYSAPINNAVRPQTGMPIQNQGAPNGIANANAPVAPQPGIPGNHGW